MLDSVINPIVEVWGLPLTILGWCLVIGVPVARLALWIALRTSNRPSSLYSTVFMVLAGALLLTFLHTWQGA